MKFEHVGLQCRISVGGLGILCGYVQPPEDWSGDPNELDVHGGVTWDSTFDKLGPGRWIGFDTGHGGDGLFGDGERRDIDYVEAQCRRLAEQIKAKGGANAARNQAGGEAQ